MAEKTIVLVTGGNTGIGYESVKALYASSEPHIVLMGSRSLSKAHDAIQQLQSEVTETKSEVVPMQIDIEDDASIEKLHKDIESKYGKLDVLVNNAGKFPSHAILHALLIFVVGGSHDGVMYKNPTAAGLREAFDHTYSLNVTSTHVLTHTLAPLIIKSSRPRILFVTSGLSSLELCAKDNHPNMPAFPGGWYVTISPKLFARDTFADLNNVGLNRLFPLRLRTVVPRSG